MPVSSVAEVIVAYLLVALLAAAMLGLAAAFLRLIRQHVIARWRARRSLSPDWLAAFERDLHEYVSQTWASAREAERRD